MPHIVSRSSTSARRSSSPRPRSVASFPVWLAVGTAGLALGCHTGGAGLEPRYVAVHNAMTAMGLAQTGAISEGRLEEGGEARLEVLGQPRPGRLGGAPQGLGQAGPRRVALGQPLVCSRISPPGRTEGSV